MEKVRLKYLIDALMLLSFLIIAMSGFILWIIFPSGSGAGRAPPFIFDRFQWIFIHDWLSVLLVILIFIHLILNWNWIKSMTKNIFIKNAK